ncbi:MAG: NUDIX hydrolase [Candidatus Omnitrophica bacterium]|nr:NUDIX hydrolase [Candidatus Omnitrophota bacterium]
MKNKFKGKLIKVFTKKTRLPNGEIINLEIVKHPGAVLIVPFVNKNKIILLKQYRPVIDQYLYELPAGTLEANESELSCAKRELIEETGYSTKKIKKIGQIYPCPGYSTEKIIFFTAQDLTTRGNLLEKDEIIQSNIYTKEQINKLFKKGKIVDAKTICALNMIGWI